MRTDDLIATLARDPATTPLRPARIGGGVLALVMVCIALFLTLIGLRADLAHALTTPLVAVKTLLPALLGGAGLVAVLRLMRPEGADTVRQRGVLLAALAAAGLLYAAGFATQARSAWFADLSPVSVMECLRSIILISLPALALSFVLVRRGATTAPARTGAALGLAVAGVAAAGYSLYCTQDNPIFYVTWYGAAILSMIALGAVAGARLLRW
ncbi:MAG: DUF1109 domain-containing protein [Paracoccaceae bacterium]|jgi:hypothetical protein|nr:DUF1109 domain-containing protein [Paracoccaceae bacterium]